MRDEGYSARRSGAIPLPAGMGTRSTLRLGPASAAPTPSRTNVLILPLRLGRYRLAIEAARVIEVVPGASWTGPPDAERPVVTADLYRTLGVLAPESRETLLARADGQLGRGSGRLVAFAVDRAERLVKVPLENFAPLPSIAREQIEVDFIAGVVRLDDRDENMAFLVDPVEIAADAGEAV